MVVEEEKAKECKQALLLIVYIQVTWITDSILITKARLDYTLISLIETWWYVEYVLLIEVGNTVVTWITSILIRYVLTDWPIQIFDHTLLHSFLPFPRKCSHSPVGLVYFCLLLTHVLDSDGNQGDFLSASREDSYTKVRRRCMMIAMQ